MTLQEKLSEIAHYAKCSYNSIARRSATKMYDWVMARVKEYLKYEFQISDFVFDDGFDRWWDDDAMVADCIRFIESGKQGRFKTDNNENEIEIEAQN